MENTIAAFLTQYPWIVIVALAWSLPWKGVALWKAARNHHEWWFIIFLFLNTLGLVEIFYIFIFSKINKRI
ncbi:MAG: DUF5652 family protein [bacterium]